MRLPGDMRPVLPLLIILWHVCVSDAQLTDEDLVFVFFENYNIVWPEDANKLAYTFLSSVLDQTIPNRTMLVIDDAYLLDPTKPPDENTQHALIHWLQTTAFDSSVRYYQILKDFDEGTYEIPPAEIALMAETLGKAAPLADPRENSSSGRSMKREAVCPQPHKCFSGYCESNFVCLEGGGGCVCKKSFGGRFCHPARGVKNQST